MKQFEFLKVYRVLNACNILLAFACLGLIAYFFTIPSGQEGGITRVRLRNLVRNVGAIHTDTASICSGPLALQPSDEAFPLPGLKKEIVFLGCNERPDAPENPEILLSLINSNEQRAIPVGEHLFFDCQGESIHFSAQETPLSMTTEVKDGQLIGVVALEMPQMNRAVEWSWKVTPQVRKSLQGETQKAFQALKTGKLWGPDQLLILYGGDEYRSEKNKLRLEIDGKMIRVDANTQLVWDENWSETCDLSPEKIIARVNCLSDEQVEWVIWGLSGMENGIVKMRLQKDRSWKPGMSNVMTNIRRRTNSMISCRINSKSRLLRAGDWLEMRDGAWKTLRTVDDINGCVQGDQEAELFIFDGVEKCNGQWQVKGHAFNGTRTQVEPVNISLAKAVKKTINRYDDEDDDDDFFDDDDDDDFLNSFMSGDDDD